MKRIQYRTGIGFDAHQLIKGRKLILGGVHIPFEYGLLGHSDADVLTHAIIDALLGATNLGNIGILFPDTDLSHKDKSSIEMLQNVSSLLLHHKFEIVNLDAVVICEKPKISPYVEQMKQTIAQACNNISLDSISIKGKTTEGMGFTGEGKGIAALATCLVQKRMKSFFAL